MTMFGAILITGQRPRLGTIPPILSVVSQNAYRTLHAALLTQADRYSAHLPGQIAKSLTCTSLQNPLESP